MKDIDNRLYKTSTTLFILNILASALNYLCQIIMARVLTVESFGTINSIFSFMMIIAVPGATLTMIVAKYYASVDEKTTEDDKKKYLYKRTKAVTALTVVVFVMLLIFQKPIGHILSIGDISVIILAFILASLGFYQPLYSGVFSGKRCFVLVGAYSLLIPLYKIISIIISYMATTDDRIRLYITLFIMVIGTIITALIGQWKAVGNIYIINKEKTGRLFGKEDISALILNISLMLYMNIDLLSVRYHGRGDESGLYSSVLLFGRIIFYFATTLGTILLPSAANNSITEEEKTKTLNKTLIMMIVFALVCIIPINLGKNIIINILYGRDYLAAAKYVKYVCLISLSLCIYTILVNYVIGLGKTKCATYVMVAVDIAIVLIAFCLTDVSAILVGIGVVGLIGAIAIYLWEIYFRSNRSRKGSKLDE